MSSTNILYHTILIYFLNNILLGSGTMILYTMNSSSTDIGTALKPSSTTIRAGAGYGDLSMCRWTYFRKKFSSTNWEKVQSINSGSTMVYDKGPEEG